MNDARRLIVAAAGVLVLLAGQAMVQETRPQDWPRWRGPHQNGIADGNEEPADSWPATGPKLLWKSVRADDPAPLDREIERRREPCSPPGPSVGVSLS